MLTITTNRVGKHTMVEAHTRYMTYFFSPHSLERTMQRSTNLKSLADLEKPVRRIIRCLTNDQVERWIIKQGLGTKVIIHDADIHMMYIVARKVNQYEVVTTFNEFFGAYDNTRNTPEIWVSLTNQ